MDAHPGREQFRQHRPHAGENTRREKAERESEQQSRDVAHRDQGVSGHHENRARRVQDEIPSAPDAVVGPGTDQVADERAEDDDREISTATEDGELALGLQEGRQPRRDRVIAALSAGRQQRCRDRGRQHGGREDFKEVRGLAGGGKVFLAFLEHGRLFDPLPHEEHEQRR
jgi:hypothetical protein